MPLSWPELWRHFLCIRSRWWVQRTIRNEIYTQNCNDLPQINVSGEQDYVKWDLGGISYIPRPPLFSACVSWLWTYEKEPILCTWITMVRKYGEAKMFVFVIPPIRVWGKGWHNIKMTHNLYSLSGKTSYRKVSKPREHCCQGACQISERLEKL